MIDYSDWFDCFLLVLVLFEIVPAVGVILQLVFLGVLARLGLGVVVLNNYCFVGFDNSD
jgi:hypothetical protein